jgi:hypothetical protein
MDAIQQSMCAISADKYPGASTYFIQAEEDHPGMRMKAGDLVVCARVKARPGDVAVVEGNGKTSFIRCYSKESKSHGVVVGVIRELGLDQ